MIIIAPESDIPFRSSALLGSRRRRRRDIQPPRQPRQDEIPRLDEWRRDEAEGACEDVDEEEADGDRLRVFDNRCCGCYVFSAFFFCAFRLDGRRYVFTV